MEKDDIRRIIGQVMEKHPLKANVRRVSLFGSRVDGTEGPDSDIDLIVEMSEAVGLFAFIGLQHDLEDQFGVHVDMTTPNGLSPYIQEKVLKSAQVLYEREQ